MSDKKRCFVLMGFGTKVDFKTNRSLDLDKTYKIIQLAIKDAGLECVRADDIVHSGVIDKPMYENLLNADVAIADLSTSNENAIYELGVRHALKPRTTIVIAEKQFKFPFDLGHVVIRPYEHLGTGIDFEEAERLRTELAKAITTIIKASDTDSPVYTFLPGLRPPELAASSGTPLAAASLPAPPAPDKTFTALLEVFKEARRAGDFTLAKQMLERLRVSNPDDPYLVQQLALATYKSKQPNALDALKAAREILQKLEPRTSGDPETLGLWGAIHKRLWEETADRAALDEGIRAYERGFYMKLDYYTGINYAFMLDDRAHHAEDAAEATCDRVLARRVRRQLLGVVETALEALPRGADGKPQDPAEAYWLGATRVEALLGLGDPKFEAARAELFAAPPESWMIQSTQSQLDKLAALLQPRPRG